MTYIEHVSKQLQATLEHIQIGCVVSKLQSFPRHNTHQYVRALFNLVYNKFWKHNEASNSLIILLCICNNRQQLDANDLQKLKSLNLEVLTVKIYLIDNDIQLWDYHLLNLGIHVVENSK